MDWLFPWIISSSFFVFAYLIYRFLLLLFRRFTKNEWLFSKYVESLKYPILFIFLEIAGIASINTLGLKSHHEAFYNHLGLVLVIATTGWVAGTIIRATYHHFIDKYETDQLKDVHLRSTITQIHLIYRLMMCVLTVVTLAVILLTFPKIKTLGIGILSSAGIAGLAMGIAARPILLNLMAGFQIAMTKTINIGDAILIDGESCRIEDIFLTYVIAKTWDMRRLIIPVSYFIDRKFENWDIKSPELLGAVFIRCDWSTPVELLRKEFYRLLEEAPLWDRKKGELQITDCNDQSLEVRLTVSAEDSSSLFDLKCYIREKMIAFLHDQHKSSLPFVRYSAVDNPIKN